MDLEQVAPGVVADSDANENIVRLELLHLSKRSDTAILRRLLFETLPDAIPEQAAGRA